MHKRSLAFVFFALLALLLAACSDELSMQQDTLSLQEQDDIVALSVNNAHYYVISFNGNKLPRNAEEMVASAGGTIVRTLPQIGVALVAADASFAETSKQIKRVQAVEGLGFHTLPDATHVTLPELDADSVTDADAAFYSEQWSIRRVNAPAAWEAGVTGSHDTVVAVIDTGVANNHPDLAPNLVYEACYSVAGPCSAYPAYSYHGTHVAGSVAAAFGHGAAVGVGPDLGIASYNVFEVVETPEGPALGAFDFPVWEAIIDAADRGFEVVNMSLGGYGTKQENAQGYVAWNRVANYARKKGTVLVASAGNEALDLNGSLYSVPSDLPGVINVAATGIWPLPEYPQEGFEDVRANYSNVGATLDVAAPGGDCGPTDDCDSSYRHMILSTYVIPNPNCALLEACQVGYAWAGGTSMASPHVAGVVGLMLDEDPSLNPNQVSAKLRRTAHDLGDRQQFGHGMVDAYEATR